MKERPILFSAPMVRAILAGTKTQTRRVLKAEPPPGAQRVIRPFGDERLQWAATDPHDMEQGQLVLGEAPRCPYGAPGDRLWVREAWRADSDHDDAPPRDIPEGSHVWFEADRGLSAIRGLSRMGKLRPSMFMPRWASRITLEVTGARVERLQSISEADARAEGADEAPTPMACMYMASEVTRTRYREGYAALWEQINGPGSWDANPWVWVVEFKRA